MPATRALVTVTVNGRRESREVECRRLLSDFLRHDLGLTGTTRRMRARCVWLVHGGAGW